MIKAIIFDFDDTLVDADTLHIEAWEKTLVDHNIKNFDDFRSLRAEKMMGKSSLHNAQLIVEHYKINTTPEDFFHKKTKIFIELITRLKLLPGAIHSLKLFKKAGLKLAIATGSPKEYIEKALKQFKIFNYFTTIITSEDVSKGKPDPETYLKACQELRLLPKECLVIEDATAGVESAKAAGCKCIAIPNKNVSTQDYSQADLVLDSLEKITRNSILGLGIRKI